MKLKKIFLYSITSILAAGAILSIILGGIGLATRSGGLMFIAMIIFFVSLVLDLAFAGILAICPQLLPENRGGDQA